MILSHCQHIESQSPKESVDQLLNDSNSDIFLAVSKGFYEVEDQKQYKSIYAEYEKKYYESVQEFSLLIGDPLFSVDHLDSRFPDWAFGDHVTVWSFNEIFLWLRLRHEDRECPIIIAMAKHTP